MVRIPSGIDQREWIATHTLGLYHNINQLYDSISEMCAHCRNMTGPEKRRFTWERLFIAERNLEMSNFSFEKRFEKTDDRGKAIKYSAPQHCAMVFSYCQDKLSDTELFPTKFGNKVFIFGKKTFLGLDFPYDFIDQVQVINFHLWSVLCHIYHAHWIDVQVG